MLHFSFFCVTMEMISGKLHFCEKIWPFFVLQGFTRSQKKCKLEVFFMFHLFVRYCDQTRWHHLFSCDAFADVVDCASSFLFKTKGLYTLACTRQYIPDDCFSVFLSDYDCCYYIVSFDRRGA